MFDLDRLEAFCVKAISRFAEAHRDERFHAFAIDADLLCLGDVEGFDEALAYARAQGQELNAAEIEALRLDTGDWEYQGFAEMTDAEGFDRKAYEKHYNLDDAAQKTSEYGLAMDALVERLKARHAFDELPRTEDFVAVRVEHSY